jgi:hypothetical protein
MIEELFHITKGYNLFVREWGNGMSFPLCAAIVVVLTMHFYNVHRSNPRGWAKGDGFNWATTLYFLFIAEGLRSFSVWIPLRAANHGARLSMLAENLVSISFIVSYALLVAVVMRCLWMFASPPPIRKFWTLVLSLAGTAAILTLANM